MADRKRASPHGPRSGVSGLQAVDAGVAVCGEPEVRSGGAVGRDGHGEPLHGEHTFPA